MGDGGPQTGSVWFAGDLNRYIYHMRIFSVDVE